MSRWDVKADSAFKSAVVAMLEYRKKRSQGISNGLNTSGKKPLETLRKLDSAEDRTRQAFISRWSGATLTARYGSAVSPLSEADIRIVLPYCGAGQSSTSHPHQVIAALDRETRACTARNDPPLAEHRQLETTSQRAIDAFDRRWSGVTVKRPSGLTTTLGPHTAGSSYGRARPGRKPITSARELNAAFDRLANEYPARSVPLFAGSRYRAHEEENQRLQELLSDLNEARQRASAAYSKELQELLALLADAEAARIVLRDEVAQAIRTNVARLPAVFKRDRTTVETLGAELDRSLAPGIADRGDPSLALATRDLNSFTIQVGYIVERPFQVVQNGSVTAETSLAQASTPALVNLHETGGFITDSPSALTSAIVRILSTNPAGSVKLQVFDQQTYGKVIDYILDLDEEAQGPLLASPIATTVPELKAMLDDVEHHMGFVTMKYVKGKYKSLLDYNASAGAMTEPARLIVLTGFPNGFSRPHGMDEDAYQQLCRIVKSGRAAGVYALVLTQQGASNPGLPGLPAFFDGRADETTWPPAVAIAAKTFPVAQSGTGTVADLRRLGAKTLFSLSSTTVWQPAPFIPRPDVVRAMKRLAQDIASAPVRMVDPAGVAKLALKRGPLVDPLDPSTWWGLSSLDGVEAPVGVRGASDVQMLAFQSTVTNNGLLAGGQSRSGKSTFLHALITELCRRYSPDELQLCLLDLKFGVEFSAYRRLPHARIVGLETGTEFATAVLDDLIKEIDKRSQLFTAVTVSNLKDYRNKAGTVLPRILLIMDEFTFAFEKQGSDNIAFGVALQRLIKQGGAYGVHCALATQSIAHGFDVPRDALKEIPMRVALRSDETASRMLLADTNPAAAFIEHAGEALYNGSHGQPAANTPFQSTWVSLSDAEQASVQLATKWKASGHKSAVRVFDTRIRAPFPTALRRTLSIPSANGPLQVPLGLPFGLGAAVGAKLGRSTGGNLVAVIPSDSTAPLTACALTTSLSTGSKAVFVDFAGLGSQLSTFCEPIIATAKANGHAIVTPLGNQIEQVITQLADTARNRQDQGQFSLPPTMLILVGLERAGVLRSGQPTQTALQELVAQGPTVGIHTAVIVERYATFEQKVGSYVLEDFDHRVIGPLATDQSITLADTSDTSTLSKTKLTYYDKGRGLARRILAFEAPPITFWGGTL